jgi:predicted amidophosphoribosyltransferase
VLFIALLVWIGLSIAMIGWMILLTEDHNPCPHCGKEIKATALKCKHCRSDFVGASVGSVSGLK